MLLLKLILISGSRRRKVELAQLQMRSQLCLLVPLPHALMKNAKNNFGCEAVFRNKLVLNVNHSEVIIPADY